MTIRIVAEQNPPILTNEQLDKNERAQGVFNEILSMTEWVFGAASNDQRSMELTKIVLDALQLSRSIRKQTSCICVVYSGIPELPKLVRLTDEHGKIYPNGEFEIIAKGSEQLV